MSIGSLPNAATHGNLSLGEQADLAYKAGIFGQRAIPAQELVNTLRAVLGVEFRLESVSFGTFCGGILDTAQATIDGMTFAHCSDEPPGLWLACQCAECGNSCRAVVHSLGDLGAARLENHLCGRCQVKGGW